MIDLLLQLLLLLLVGLEVEQRVLDLLKRRNHRAAVALFGDLDLRLGGPDVRLDARIERR